MPLPSINGEFTIVRDPDIKFSNNGKAWALIRAVAKDRVKDSNGNWADGEPMFIDIFVQGQAENLYESVCKGDSIIVSGKLRSREYDHNGEKRVGFSILADSIGPSLRWGPARTKKAAESAKPSSSVAADILGGQEIDQPDEAPF